MNTQESNKMIAEFMGLELEETLEGLFVYARKEQSPIKLNDIRTEFYEVHELQYHTSWNWLMPVVEKIEEHGYDFIATKRRATRTYDANFMDEVNNYVVYVEDCKDRQEATYKAVVEFINQHKNK